jgi:selenocysteine lyase/cysteine desulfurase
MLLYYICKERDLIFVVNATQAIPVEVSQMSGITIIRSGNAQNIVSMLKKEKIIVSARGEGLRVSVNIFNNESDIDTFISALIKLDNLE